MSLQRGLWRLNEVFFSLKVGFELVFEGLWFA